MPRLKIDPYLPLLIVVIIVAIIMPARGNYAGIVATVTNFAIAVLFFLYGARLTTAAVIRGISHWRLQAVVLISTFILFPALGWIVNASLGGGVNPSLSAGLMFVCFLPSTVQSSIAFTSIARGNVPAALCCASLSNLLGIVVTPALVAVFLTSSHANVGYGALWDLVRQLLAPFALGQAMRPWIGTWMEKNKKLTSYFDRGSILLVVYEAFGAGVVSGIWSRIGVWDLCVILGLDLLLLTFVLVTTTCGSRLLGFNKEDEITIVFCGSKKSLASGVPMANVLFAPQVAGILVVPLILFHQAQLFACAFLAQRYAERSQTKNDVDGNRLEPSASDATA